MGIRKTIGMIGLIILWVMPVDGKVNFGVRAGLGRSWLVQKIDLDYHSGIRFGYSVGVLADIPFYRRFSFRPEISLVNQGGSYISCRSMDEQPTIKNTYNYYSLQTPLNIAFNIPITGVRMAVFGGPVLDFHLWGKVKARETGEAPPPTTEHPMKSFDLGVNGGISVEYKNIFFSINAIIGTLDRCVEKTKTESSIYQNNLTFSLGYFFR